MIRRFKNHIVQLLLLWMCVLVLPLNADIIGKIKMDTTKWTAVAYLSIIPDFSQINTISYPCIIDRAEISADGQFMFSTKKLPEGIHLYRIHISKLDDPAASLIIGGIDHNHMFLFANRDAEIKFVCKNDNSLFQSILIGDDYLNESLLYINHMANLIDTIDILGLGNNKEFIREAIYDQIRDYADTCSNPLLSLYAIYQSNYQFDYKINPEYYSKYIDKWESEDSEYFQTFRNQLNYKLGFSWASLGLIFITILLVLIFVFFGKKILKKKKNLIMDLTVQERRIYNLLRAGKSNKEIALEYSISISTVKSHVNSIYSKLKIDSRKDILNFNNEHTS